MVFRTSNKAVEKPEDYLTGKAHPTVFQGGEASGLRMVKLAHDIRRESVPPMVQIASFEEDLALNGVDYFEAPGRDERFFDTPEVIARIVRSTKQTRRMVVSAKGSFDANSRPLKFHWAVLRGDPERIKINRMEKDGSVAELLVPWHERRPILPGSPMESNRVDIGVFAHNGVHYSAPAFICFFYLDDEARTYAPDGRVVEMFYGYGSSTIGFPASRLRAKEKGYDICDWPLLLSAVVGGASGVGGASVPREGQVVGGASLPRELLAKHFTPEALAALAQAAKDLDAAVAHEAEPGKKHEDATAARNKLNDPLNAAKKKADDAKKAAEKDATDATKKALADAEAELKDLQAKQKQADGEVQTARSKLDAAQRAQHNALTADRPALKGSVKSSLEAALNTLKDDPALYPTHAKAIEEGAAAIKDAAMKKPFLDARDELLKLGLLKAKGDGFVVSGGTGFQPVAGVWRFGSACL